MVANDARRQRESDKQLDQMAKAKLEEEDVKYRNILAQGAVNWPAPEDSLIQGQPLRLSRICSNGNKTAFTEYHRTYHARRFHDGINGVPRIALASDRG